MEGLREDLQRDGGGEGAADQGAARTVAPSGHGGQGYRIFGESLGERRGDAGVRAGRALQEGDRARAPALLRRRLQDLPVRRQVHAIAERAMVITSAVTQLRTTDLGQSIRFYTEKVGL